MSPVLSRVATGQGFGSIVSYKRAYLASQGGGAYQIQRSLRFNSADSAYLSRTPGSAGNRKTWTWAGWVKRSKLGTTQRFFATFDGSNQEYWRFDSNDTLRLFESLGTLQTTQVFRDVSAWYHIVVAVDTTQATASDRIKFYLNGTQVTTFSTATYPSQNADGRFNSAVPHYLGTGTVEYFDGYLADVHFIDGQALDPSAFTETDATTGQLIPKAFTGSYGTNGFKLNFSDNSTAAALGTDSSSNGNTWTVNNLSVTAGSGNDSLVDTPTSYGTGNSGGDVRGNYATLNPLNNSATLSNGNLQTDAPTAIWYSTVGTIYVSSGKWYWEVTPAALGLSMIGVANKNVNTASNASSHDATNSYAYYNFSGNKFGPTSNNTGYGATYAANDVIGVALDLDNGTLVFYKNNTSQGTAYSGLTGIELAPFVAIHDYVSTGTLNVNFGQRAFAYTAPEGFKALCDTNLPTPTIAKGNTVMDVKTWTGDGTTGTGSITGFAFSPDLVWAKSRSDANSHLLYDTVRGASTSGSSKALVSNASIAEGSSNDNTTYGYLSSFNSDGFSYFGGSSPTYFSQNGASFVAWAWDAGTSTVTNTSGSISAQVRANASAGFSICTFSIASASASINTFGHGLGVAPSFVIFKVRNVADEWTVYHGSISSPTSNWVTLNTTNAAGGGTSTFSTSSTTFGIRETRLVAGGTSGNIVAYCFAPVAGYSSFGSYVGNGSATSGPFVYLGFRPRWVLIKNSDNGGASSDWWLFDSARGSININGTVLYPNLSGAEFSSNSIFNMDFLSNGFRLSSTTNPVNQSAQTHIYAAFAESPFQYARAR